MSGNSETKITNVSVVEKTEELNENKTEVKTDSCEKDYSIYNYFKAHPASVIACFSALVAVITFFAQLLTYLINKNVLDYWGYSADYASLGSGSLLYSAISAIAYGLVHSFAIMCFFRICDVYFERKRYFLTIDYLLKKYKTNEKVNFKRVRLAKKSYSEDYDKFESVEASIRKVFNEIEDLRKENKKEKLKAFMGFLKNLVPVTFILLLSAFVMSLMIARNIEFGICMLSMALVQLVTFSILYFIEQKLVLKNKLIKKDVENLETEELLERAKFKMEYPLDNLYKSNKGIRNSTFFMFIVYILIISIVFVASYSFSIRDSEAKRKAFEIVSMDNQEYAVVYHNESSYFLEKVRIADNKLIIYIKHQRIVENADISFTVRTFDEIIKDDGEVLQ